MSTINPKIKQRAAQLAINTNPSFRHIRVDLDSDGNLIYVDLVTGSRSTPNDPSAIFNSRRTLGLVDYRNFDPGVGRGALSDIGRSAGALQIESEVMVVNEFLAAARTDPAKAQQLRNLGLDRMIGEQVTGELLKFNTQGQGRVVQAIKALGVAEKAASASMTDEGYTFITLKGKNRSINATEASYLRILSGAEQIQPAFLAELAKETVDPTTGKVTGNWFKIGKLAKRLQSTMSPRNVAVGEEFIRQHLDRPIVPGGRVVRFEERALGIDSVAAKIELMFRDPTMGIPIRESDGLVLSPDDIRYGESVVGFENIPSYKLSEQERQFMLAGVGDGNRAQGLTELEKAYPRGSVDRATAVRDLWDRRLTVRRNQELNSLRETYGMQDWEIDRLQTMFEEANAELADSTHVLHSTDMTYAQKQYELIKGKVKTLKNSSIDVDNKLGIKLSSVFDGMEKGRDGQFYITTELLDNMISAFQSELDRTGNAIKAAGVPMTLEQTQNIKALEKQIEHLQKAKQKIDSGDIIARVNIGIGQFKGEAMVLGPRAAGRFKDPVTGLVPYVIGDLSAIKSEVGSSLARNILFDIGESGTEVFSDPLMMLYHGDYFTQPAMIASMRDNALFGLNKTQEFMQNGAAPKEVMEAIRKDIEGDLKTISEVMLDPQTRMSHLRKKREAEEIMAQMASGIKANEIPAMVRRVADYYSSQVVRYKDGRADVVMPTAGRFSLRTFESRLVNAEDFNKFSYADINLADYGLTSATEKIKTLGFRIKDHTLMMAGDAAYLYQHSLGGFDLDDKGIPLMSTFKDSSGNKRLAFLGLRQPTSFQEYVAMTADLSDAGTVHALFENNLKFKSALQDDTVLAALGIDKTSETYLHLNQMVNGKNPSRGINREDVDKNGLEQMIIKIMESNHVFPEGLPSLTNQQVIRMAMLQSPSALGLDRLIEDASGAMSPLGQFMTNLGLDPNKIPAPFDSDSVFQLLQTSNDRARNAELYPKLSAALGYTVNDADHLQKILNAKSIIASGGSVPGFNPEDDIKAVEVIKRFTEQIMSETADSTAEESIGLFVNRQATAVNVLEKSKQILTGELGLKETDKAYRDFLNMSSVITLPASEAVDVAKQVGAEQVLYNFGAAVQMMQTQGMSLDEANELYKAYVATLKSPTHSPLAAFNGIKGLTPEELQDLVIPMKLSALGDTSLRGFSSVGYVRGKQIAQQIAATGSINEEELYGLQELMFDIGEGTTSGYARIKNQDKTKVRDEIVKGLEQAKSETSDANAQATLQERITQLKQQETDIALASLFMKRGTAAYDKYADVEQMVRAVMEIHGSSEAIKTQSLQRARQAARTIEPTIKHQYKDPVANIVDTVSKKIDQLKAFEKEFRETQSETTGYGIKKLRTETLSTIHQGMSAAIEAERAAGRPTGPDNILDMMETLAASLEAKNFEAGKLLQSPTLTGADGDPGIETMTNLFSAMRQRIIARSSQKRADVAAVLRAQEAYGDIGELRDAAGQVLSDKMAAGTGLSAGIMGPTPISTQLADMTKDEAEAILKASRKLRKARKRKGEGSLTAAEEIITQFAGRVKDHAAREIPDALRPGETQEAYNAFMYHVAGRRQLEDAARKAADAVTGFLTGTAVPATARDAVARSRETATGIRSAGTVYKRFSESLKSGALGDALQNKGVRRGLAAAAALSVFGFIRAHRRDHAKDDVTGPPLLPGGSAYESGYPNRQAVIENLRTINPVTRGMQYKVYTSGSSEDAEKLRSMAGSVTDGPVNSTMYSSLPLLGQDPYSQVASKF